MPNSTLSSALQSIDELIAKHETPSPSWEEVLTSVDKILDTYKGASKVDVYQDILADIDDILVKYKDQPLSQSNSTEIYQDVVQDIDQILAQYDTTESPDSLNIPDNTDVSKLTKFSRLTPEDQDISTDPTTPEQAVEDPDKQGIIRVVPGAHLVYKRLQDDNTFEELWIYNLSQMKTDVKIRHAILAGTAITTSNTMSPDGTQQYELCTMGNAECMKIKGLTE